jgi:hypothetical protein
VQRLLLAAGRELVSRRWTTGAACRPPASDDQARRKLASQSAQVLRVAQLQDENRPARAARNAPGAQQVKSVAAEILYDTPDPYSRKVIIDRGAAQGVIAGSPVHQRRRRAGPGHARLPAVVEVTLLTDRDAAMPVLNTRTRTAARPSAMGDRQRHGTALHGRQLPTCRRATCSPPRAWTASTRPGCRSPRWSRWSGAPNRALRRSAGTPVARPTGVRHVLVLEPVGLQMPPRPEPGAGRIGPRANKKGARQMIMPRSGQLLLPANPLFIAFSLLMALLLNMVPMGRQPAMPDFLALVLVFWNVHQSRRVGVGLAFCFGLVMDVHHGALLGQHALSYTAAELRAVALIHRRLLWFTRLRRRCRCCRCSLPRMPCRSSCA